MKSPLRLAAFVLALAAGATSAFAQDRLTVVAVNQPLADFAARLGGSSVEVTMPVPPGEDPAFWKPTAEEVSRIQGADLILLNGAGYAGWTDKVSLPRQRTVHTSRNFAGRYIAAKGVAHSHGGSGAHDHGGTATHTWLDFQLAAMHAKTVGDALKLKAPAASASIAAEMQALAADLAALDAEARETAERAGDRRLFASHPVYQYFARAYGLEIESFVWEPGAMPDADQWAAFDARRGAGPARMLWEGRPTAEIREALARRDVEVVVFDPGGWASAMPFVPRMRANLEALDAAFSGS